MTRPGDSIACCRSGQRARVGRTPGQRRGGVESAALGAVGSRSPHNVDFAAPDSLAWCGVRARWMCAWAKASSRLSNRWRWWARRSRVPTASRIRRWCGRTPLSSTVMPRDSSSSTISPNAWAPVASSDLHLGESQDHDPHVADGGELGEEALRGAEEQRAVEAVDDDVLAQQLGLIGAVDNARRRAAAHARPRC